MARKNSKSENTENTATEALPVETTPEAQHETPAALLARIKAMSNKDLVESITVPAVLALPGLLGSPEASEIIGRIVEAQAAVKAAEAISQGRKHAIKHAYDMDPVALTTNKAGDVCFTNLAGVGAPVGLSLLQTAKLVRDLATAAKRDLPGLFAKLRVENESDVPRVVEMLASVGIAVEGSPVTGEYVGTPRKSKGDAPASENASPQA